MMNDEIPKIDVSQWVGELEQDSALGRKPGPLRGGARHPATVAIRRDAGRCVAREGEKTPSIIRPIHAADARLKRLT